MSKHLYVNATYITAGPKPWPKLLECGTKDYLIRRVQFWKWRLHQTMGRPVLLLRDRYKDVTGVDPAPNYPVTVELKGEDK